MSYCYIFCLRCQDVFSKNTNERKKILRTTHLVCSVTNNEKFLKAQKWGTTVVVADWILQCYQQKTNVDPSRFNPYVINNTNDSHSSISFFPSTPKPGSSKGLKAEEALVKINPPKDVTSESSAKAPNPTVESIKPSFKIPSPFLVTKRSISRGSKDVLNLSDSLNSSKYDFTASEAAKYANYCVTSDEESFVEAPQIPTMPKTPVIEGFSRDGCKIWQQALMHPPVTPKDSPSVSTDDDETVLTSAHRKKCWALIAENHGWARNKYIVVTDGIGGLRQSDPQNEV